MSIHPNGIPILIESLNLPLLLVSTLLLVSAGSYLILRWEHLGIFDVFVGMIGIYFGGTALIDGVLYSGDTDSTFSTIFVHLHIGLVLLITTLLVNWLLSRQPGTLEVSWVLEKARLISLWQALMISFMTLMFASLLLGRFGALGIVGQNQFITQQVELPYWASSLYMVLPPLLLASCLLVTVRCFSTSGTALWLLGPVLIMLFFVQGLYGRRAMFAFMVIFYLAWFLLKGIHPLSWKGIIFLTVGIPCLLGFSNIFQTIREPLSEPFSLTALITEEVLTPLTQQPLPPSSAIHEPSQNQQGIPPPSPSLSETAIATVKGITTAATEMKKTVDNLEDRMPLWKYNYDIWEAQWGLQAWGGMGGSLFLQTLKNVTPKFLWPQKQWKSIERKIESFYGLPVHDKPQNDFAVAQADIGLWSFVGLPLFYGVFFAAFSTVFWLARGHPIFIGLVAGRIFDYVLNIERSFESNFLIFRYVALLAILYFGINYSIYVMKNFGKLALGSRA